MAKHNYGSLGGLTKGDYTTLDNTFKDRNMSLGKIGGDTYGYNVTPQNVFESGVGLVNPAFGYGLTMYNDIATNRAVARAQGLPTDFSLAGLKSNIDIDGSRFNSLQNTIDINKDGKVDQREMQNYGMGRGLTAYNVDLNPMQGYTPGTVNVNTLGKIDPTAGVFAGYESKTVSPTVYTQQQVDNITSGIGQGVGATGDLGGATDVGYKGSTGGFVGFGKTEGVGDSGPTGLGDTEQTGDQTSITDTSKGKDLSNTFADDAGASSGDDGTYICTALYEMGDMKKYIYKYDQVYGKRVDPNVYRGYCVWGKYVATKLRNKGIIYKIAKPLALAWAKQMAFDLSKGKHGKNNKVVKVISRIGESVCYALGVIANIKLKKGVRYG